MSHHCRAAISQIRPPSTPTGWGAWRASLLDPGA